ncbi:hypothetical protein MKX03_014012 [Papaver bracteatum]|nr:hypothetical protein MKX03_014012 [Papaver bracteatum]
MALYLIVHSFEDVSKHNKTKNWWLIISRFKIDSTRDMLEKYYVGEIDTTTVSLKIILIKFPTLL